MKVRIENSEITNPTLQHLEAWLLAINEQLEEESPFDTLEELSMQLLHWKNEFVKNNPFDEHWGDCVKVRLYANDVILISDDRSGEYLHITEDFGELFKKKDRLTNMLVKALVVLTVILMVLSYQVVQFQKEIDLLRKGVSHE